MLDVSDEDSLCRWLLHQALTHRRLSDAEKLDVYYFVGLEDGAFEGFVYSRPNGAPNVSLLFSQRRPGAAPPSEQDWGALAGGSRWHNGSNCSSGVSCGHMPPRVYLAEQCPLGGGAAAAVPASAACGSATGCANWTCSDAGLRLDFMTDGVFHTNRVPAFYARQPRCTASAPCTVTVDAAMTQRRSVRSPANSWLRAMCSATTSTSQCQASSFTVAS